MKRVISILLVLVVMGSLCGCSGLSNTVNKETIPKVEIYWDVIETKDDFGDPTGIYYAHGVFEGTFSNSATTDSLLNVVVYHYSKSSKDGYDPEFIFQLFEYGDQKATYSSNDKKVLKIKVDGQAYQFDLFGKSPNGDLVTYTKNTDVFNVLHNALARGENVPCIIEVGNSSYHFSINPKGYEEAYSKCKSLNG